ncbi:uncharacterized protein LOC114271382 [Camellia sinensis]|uniref:uncharacterized protein LOC114271382 n=1 Tax=Camellia sinensis TaxID=4442 RepID=UPI001035C8CC|nr:uncharacterized protein LOC114271382 [Camellia sinensis]
MIITGDDTVGISSLKQLLSHQFEMKKLGLLSYFLDLEISHDPSSYFLTQAKYISDLLIHAGLIDCKTTITPIDPQTCFTRLNGHLLSDATLYRRLVGSLVYLTITRPNIAYIGHIVNWFIVAPHCLYFFLDDSLIAWHSKKQTLVARSSTEAEYYALADTTQELMWFHWLLSDMGIPHFATTNLYCDNQSAI